MDLSSISLAELKEIERQIPKEIKRREIEDRVRVRREVEALAQSNGFSLDELFSDEKPEKVKGNKVAPKYRHPLQPELAWTGRGRKPKWIEAWLANSGSLDQLAV